MGLFDKGYNAFFEGRRYAERKEAEWIRGWFAAERHSHCGMLNKGGLHNYPWNFK